MVEHSPDTEKALKRRKDDQVRLESWKAIANHLNRSVRTVRRWESSMGMPVRRLKHSKGASVYAYQSELDSWQRLRCNQENVISDAVIEGEFGRNSSRFTSWQLAAALVVAFAVGTLSSNSISSTSLLPQSELSSSVWSRSTATTLVAPVFGMWANGQIVESLQASFDLRSRLHDVHPDARDHVSALLVRHAVSLGRIDDASAIMETIGDANYRAELRAAILFASNERPAMRAELERIEVTRNPSTVLFMGMAGLADKAKAANAQLGSKEEQRRRSLVIQGMASMQAGDVAAAKSGLSAAALTLDTEDRAFYFVGLDMLAGIHKQHGDLELAIEILEDTMDKRRRSAFDGAGIFWIMCQRNLANLYMENDRVDDANRIFNQLRDFMLLADDAFPIARQAAKS